MRIAIIGGGISGLGAAWLLREHHEITLYEAGNYVGGHSNTIDITLDGIRAPVDTGFLVHNNRTYPHLIEFFKQLGILTHPTEMTFSVKHLPDQVEWAGSSLLTLFAQKRNLLRPGFWRMVRDILKFNGQSHQLLQKSIASPCTLGELLNQEGYSQEFRHWYLLPMGAAIWSSPVDDMEDFPAQTFLQFCINHGLLQVFDRPQWKTIKNGSREYVKAVVKTLKDVRINEPVQSVSRRDNQVFIQSSRGEEQFDKVIFACHSDQTLALIKDITDEESTILSAVRYQPNIAYLHTDPNLMPMRKSAWSAWNYYCTPETDQQNPVAVTYWLNCLQDLPFSSDVFVTLNPPTEPSPEHIIQKINYAHPLLDQAAYHAQTMLPAQQGKNNSYFCGAWTRYGFHEDGLLSAVNVAKLFNVKIPWEKHHG